MHFFNSEIINGQNKRVFLIHLKQQEMQRSETKEKE